MDNRGNESGLNFGGAEGLDPDDFATAAQGALAETAVQQSLFSIFATRADAIAANVSPVAADVYVKAQDNAGKGGGRYTRTPLSDILKKVAPEIPDNVLAFVPMNGPAGIAQAYDLSGYERVVTPSGQVVVSAAQKYYDQNMVYFDGLGDNLSLPSSPDLAPASTFAISVGAYIEDLATPRPLFGWTSNTTNYCVWRINTDGSIEFRHVVANSITIQCISAPGVVVPGRLYEFGLARYGTSQWSISVRDPARHNNMSTIVATVTDASPLVQFTGGFRIGHSLATAHGFKGWLGQFWFKSDPSWEGAEDYILLPETSYFKSADGAYWLLDAPFTNPEHFGARGDAVIDKVTGLASGTNDRNALRDAYNHAAIMGTELRLVSAYWWPSGVWEKKVPALMTGANPRKHGIFLDTTREQPGTLWLAENHQERNFFISVQIPSGIQNGQGYFGTAYTFSRPIVRPKTRHVGEPALDYGLRCAPGRVTGALEKIRFLRRKGGGAHCLCFTSRCKGVSVRDCDAVGWDSTSGRFGSFALTHWGFVGAEYLIGVDTVVIEPFIVPITDDSFTMHPSGVTIEELRLRNVGRILNTSASYDIKVRGFSYVGTKNNSSGDGGQVVAHTCGDEWDRRAHPDDIGRIYSNLIVQDGNGYMLEASNPNASDRAIISMSGTATSKVLNVDGSLARDDKANFITVTPGVIPNGGTFVQDVPLPGITVADAANVRAWSSHLLDDSSVELTQTVLVNGTVRVTYHNTSGGNYNFTSPGSLNVYLPRKRLEHMINYSGVETKNIRIYGVGGTGEIIYCRNGQGQTLFQNIHGTGETHVDGFNVQNWQGPMTFSECKFPGNNEIAASQGIVVDNCKLETTALIRVTLGAGEATAFSVGNLVTGGTSGVQGEVHSKPSPVDDTILYIRLAKRGGRVFQVGETLSFGAVTGVIAAVGTVSNSQLLMRGTVSTVTLAANAAQWQEYIDVVSLPIDVRPGDKFTSDLGTFYATDYHDATSTRISVTPLPAALVATATATFDRRSRVTIRDTNISGGYRGIEINSTDLKMTGGRIAETWQYGFLHDFDANVEIDGTIFEGNGLSRVQLDVAGSTRDYICAGQASASGSLIARGLKFRDGKFVQTSFVVSATSILQGSLRDSTWIATGQRGAPINKKAITSPLAGGLAFLEQNNADSLGVAA